MNKKKLTEKMAQTRTDQDILREYMVNGEYAHAANYLRHLIQADRGKGRARRYPDKNQGDNGKSGDWEITRSQAANALRDGVFDDHSLLSLHIRTAFTPNENESPVDHQKRARETFEACLDAVNNMHNEEERNTFIMVDAAADHAIRIIEKEQRFPTKLEIRELASNKTGIVIAQDTEWTKIYALARLSFLSSRSQGSGKRW